MGARRVPLQPFNAHELSGLVLSTGRWLLHFLVLLFARHWMTGLANLCLTALLGLGLLKVAKPLRFRTHTAVRLRRFVLLVALFKGAFYLVLGESMHATADRRWFIGFQLPDPTETAGLVAQTGYSIWHLTAITGWVSLALVVWATLFLIARATQFLLVTRCLETVVEFGHRPTDTRADMLMRRASRALGTTPVPRVVQAELPEWGIESRSPVLLGLTSPTLLLSQYLADALTDAELEMVFRHEIAHVIRRDHWSRWILLWVADVGVLTVLNVIVKSAAIDLEEHLCDRLAVQTPHEAVVLASALWKTLALTNDLDCSQARSAPLPQTIPSQASGGPLRHRQMPALPKPAVPLLLGTYAGVWQNPGSLHSRMGALLEWSRELSVSQTPERGSDWRAGRNTARRKPLATVMTNGGHALRWTARLLLFLLLTAILYTKFHLALNLR